MLNYCRSRAQTWRENAEFVCEWIFLFAMRMLVKPYHFGVN